MPAIREPILGTVTIGQAPRPDVVPIIDRYVASRVRRIHRGVLDGLSRAEIEARYKPESGEPALVTRLQNGAVVELSRARMRDGVQDLVRLLENEGCDVILLLCTGIIEGLECRRARLIEPDHLIPPLVAGLVGTRQLGIIVPIASQIASESGKWHSLARPPIFATVSPYSQPPEAAIPIGRHLQERGADAILLDCIGFTERHRDALDGIGLPVILSNAVAVKAAGELLGG
jgi:protein AroM